MLLVWNYQQFQSKLPPNSISERKFPWEGGACPQTLLESSCFVFRGVCFAHWGVTPTCLAKSWIHPVTSTSYIIILILTFNIPVECHADSARLKHVSLLVEIIV